MVTVIPNLYQLTLKLQRNDIIVLCDGQTDRQLSYYNRVSQRIQNETEEETERRREDAR